MKPSAQQLRDKRYHPTVEAIYLKRQDDPEYQAPQLPSEGHIQVPIILGRPGDPNRHTKRPPVEETKEDEYVDFRDYASQYLDLQLRIKQIRERSAMYPIWAGDKPSVPVAISRKFNELSQQLFALKKCFVSPEEIMLDNTATIIQRFWRARFQRQLFLRALESIKKYKIRELSGAHRTLNSWMAQMEYADSRAQQLNFRSIARVSKVSLRFWQKWSEREAVVTNRNETKSTEQLAKNTDRHNRVLLETWRDVAMGPRSRKALATWRQSMVPVMKRELEAQNLPIPQAYVELVSAYIAMRAHRSFMFNFFLAWHTRYHSKSLRQTVIERNAFIFHKRKITTWSFKMWLQRVRNTKAYLATPEKWARYIALARAQHSAKMSTIGVIVSKWHMFARQQGILTKKRLQNKKALVSSTFKGWRETVIKHRDMKMETILCWKRAIQDPKVVVFRTWNLWAIKKRTRRSVGEQLDQSNREWQGRKMLEHAFGTWQRRAAEKNNFKAAIDLERRRWTLQNTKTNTSLLSGLYAKQRDKISAIEAELGEITSKFVQNEDEVSKLEEISTTWRIALHAMKMELMRLAIVVQKCATPKPQKRRRFSDDDIHGRLRDDDRYDQGTNSRLTMMQTSNRVIGKWERRNSDPDFADDIQIVNVNPPLDENIIQLLSIERD